MLRTSRCAERTRGLASTHSPASSAGTARTITGEVQTEHFNVGPLVRGSSFRTDVTGHAKMDFALPVAGRPLRGMYTVAATRANVIGYETRDVAAKGRVDWPVITVD